MRFSAASARSTVSFSLYFSAESSWGRFGMSDSEDTWPTNYNPGSHLHLHALGVIAVTFASFERSLDALYSCRAGQENMPTELINMYYFSLNEEKRIDAIRQVFSIYEKNAEITVLVNNILAYFLWCRNCRNQILHAERYPPSFGGDPDTLYLIKRVGKQSPQSGYMKFKLQRLRYIADRICEGVSQCGIIRIYLTWRGRPLAEVPQSLRIYVRGSLPRTLRIPRTLELDQNP